MSKMNKFQYILEIVWLIVAVFAVTAASYEFYRNGFNKSIPLYIISVIAFAVYTFRRYIRKRQK